MDEDGWWYRKTDLPDPDVKAIKDRQLQQKSFTQKFKLMETFLITHSNIDELLINWLNSIKLIFCLGEDSVHLSIHPTIHHLLNKIYSWGLRWNVFFLGKSASQSTIQPKIQIKHSTFCNLFIYLLTIVPFKGKPMTFMLSLTLVPRSNINTTKMLQAVTKMHKNSRTDMNNINVSSLIKKKMHEPVTKHHSKIQKHICADWI